MKRRLHRTFLTGSCLFLTRTFIIAAINKLELFCWEPAGKVDENTVNHVDIFSGRLLKGGRVFQQNFLIRSYELGPDSKISVGALVNFLQVIIIS